MSLFESSVNSEGIETMVTVWNFGFTFESSVNSEGIETRYRFLCLVYRLRAV